MQTIVDRAMLPQRRATSQAQFVHAPDGQEIAWQTQSSAEVRERSIASDPWSDLYAVSLLEDSGSQRIVRLEVFDSSSPSPRWSYTFPGTFGGGEVNWCHITDDGQWILGAVKIGRAHV